MPIETDASTCLALGARLCSAGLLWQSIELSSVWRELRPGHLLAREAVGSRLAAPLTAVPVTYGAGDRAFLLGRAVAAAACLLLPFGSVWLAVTLAALLGGQLYFTRRFTLVLVNADYLNLTCLAGLAAGSWPGASAGLQAVALAFVAFQGLLGYFAAGCDKLGAVNWRSGVHLVAVFQDSSHRVPWIGRLLNRPPRGLVLSWATMLFEVGFPLCLVLPAGGFWAFVAAGLLFHAVIGVGMGLPGFFWAFAATYPAMYFVHQWLAVW